MSKRSDACCWRVCCLNFSSSPFSAIFHSKVYARSTCAENETDKRLRQGCSIPLSVPTTFSTRYGFRGASVRKNEGVQAAAFQCYFKLSPGVRSTEQRACGSRRGLVHRGRVMTSTCAHHPYSGRCQEGLEECSAQYLPRNLQFHDEGLGVSTASSSSETSDSLSLPSALDSVATHEHQYALMKRQKARGRHCGRPLERDLSPER